MATPGALHTNLLSPDISELYYFLLPQMTTAERDNLVAVNGMVVYNTTTATVQVRQGGAWANV